MQTASSRFALVYIVERFSFRISEFFRRWYLGAFSAIFGATIHKLGSLDRSFALKITILNFFKPLYGDESFIGRVLGVLFRSVRIISGLFIYLLIISVSVLVYIIWTLIPVFLVVKILGF